ncbi:hypothetical protein [Prauserella muralis]|uniref:Uncharacterized protein n=1 Tax=Prauserella muralis TaxID=588067 RepID=A0A2V4B0A7_9PSEU|nr:hypothetical protein [Prauserella muralis]PXY27433.1 hypothetical protein BAY60_13440 [Prauserella muralis]TWE22867.1 hypothetical protein FHX69_4123 [Prauserella muralis]
MADITVSSDGPLFDGRAQLALRDYMDKVVDDIADQGLSLVQRNLDASIRHPTPYYETQIVKDVVGADRVIHDRDIIYGPWLEGVGSRNKTTRFKGYFSFRRARHELELRKVEIAEATLQQFLPRMRG